MPKPASGLKRCWWNDWEVCKVFKVDQVFNVKNLTHLKNFINPIGFTNHAALRPTSV